MEKVGSVYNSTEFYTIETRKKEAEIKGFEIWWKKIHRVGKVYPQIIHKMWKTRGRLCKRKA